MGCHALLQEIFQPRYLTHISHIFCIGRQLLNHSTIAGQKREEDRQSCQVTYFSSSKSDDLPDYTYTACIHTYTERLLLKMMLKLKLQYFGHLICRADSLEEKLMLGKIEGGRRRGRQRMRCLDGIRDSKDMRLSRLQETVKDREDRCAAVHGSQRVGHHCVTEQQQKGKKMIIYLKCAHIIPINLKTRQHYIPYSGEI